MTVHTTEGTAVVGIVDEEQQHQQHNSKRGALAESDSSKDDLNSLTASSNDSTMPSEKKHHHYFLQLDGGPNTSPLYSFICASTYGLISISMTMFNKAVLSVYKFNYPITIGTLQSIFSILFLWLFAYLGYIKLPKITFADCKKYFPLSVSYLLNLLIALAALEGLNVPMYNTLKRGTTLITLVGEYWFLSKIPSSKTLLSTGFLVFGAFLAGVGDLSFDLTAYCYAGVSCMMQTAYLLQVSKAGKELYTLGILYYNCLLSLPLTVIYMIVSGEFQAAIDYELLWDAQFQACLLISLLQGALLNYSVFLCTVVNSALTTTIVGQLKMMISSVIGLFFFNTVITAVGGLGLLLNTLGGVMYAFFKYQEQVTHRKLIV
eukprot:TRINITY_DN9220_c0_g1_i1.p1 TRINITY_DN9220_c0_g1~~TRINITY_DN9220_c0_g1_i1.p1  ORF type:complete len:376 (+),score=65.62 TRINITY_DN9220_c0_g1_i1:43-1170(+)